MIRSLGFEVLAYPRRFELCDDGCSLMYCAEILFFEVENVEVAIIILFVYARDVKV